MITKIVKITRSSPKDIITMLLLHPELALLHSTVKTFVSFPKHDDIPATEINGARHVFLQFFEQQE